MQGEVCKVCGIQGCIENRGHDFHDGKSFGSMECNYTGPPHFVDNGWASDFNPTCLWCAGTGHPYADESYGICKCPGMSC